MQTDDAATGGAGDDIFETSGGGNVLIGSAGLDTVSFATVAAASSIDLTTGQARQIAGATFDTLFLIENATGGGGNDAIVGSTAANVLSGLNGDDDIRAATAMTRSTGAAATTPSSVKTARTRCSEASETTG